MEAKELRIGNIVSIENKKSWPDLKGVPMEVTIISSQLDKYDKELFPESDGKISLKGEHGHYNQFSQFIKPIELSEELLVILGFESRNSTYIIENDKYEFSLFFYDAWNLYYKEKEKYGDTEIELCGYWHIHELQNLFFALTGEELTIKS
ncbi:TPA: hypothetical protein JRX02_002937 [Elizabethkingia anophelis]|uniref:hypothetical protein n=1 Tax=Elizabethkingia anophelis TaxID=1117645 RepID=UPI00296D10CC|nr:hypothetical protein [Elizabethkingia anophelis]HAY3504311.1 hypothetical protein [Elizabethkingia anophelis]HAY3512288.1 hypothetical protein [Elizabethkingia anophelis]HAY3516540.1 hypothetical protein [Elizabethkingia anophelis]HAY3520405.1 hypothetical protein [Elizabethkingia anophelis]